MPKVLFLTKLAPDIAELLTSQAPSGYEVVTAANTLPVAEQQEMAADVDFLILFPDIVDSSVLTAAKRLKLVQLVSAGFDRLDVDLCGKLGIPVANNGGANAIDVAEHTVTLILAWYRRLVEMDTNVRQGAWSAIDSGATTYTIRGKTIGLVGFGNIGRQTAPLLRAFGARVLYSDAMGAPWEIEQELGVQRVSLDELLALSDVVSLHVPLNNGTHHLINQDKLERMKTSALLVNTCRGPVVDETALVHALETQQIAGAALDVMDAEPPSPDSPLLTMKNVLLTPHTAGVTRDTWARRGEFIFANLARVWAGEQPEARVA